MTRQRQQVNHQTQPLRTHKVFNNWNVVAEGWYFALASKELKKGQVQSLKLCGQHIVLYRGESGEVYALDGYCPHMGVDLGIGKVFGEHVRCFFHHWRFNGQGECTHIPCQETIPTKTKLNSYGVIERYGILWVHPNRHNLTPFLEIPELKGEEVIVWQDPVYERTCHHHITMINGIDPQHLKTVHSLNIEMSLEIQEHSRGQIHIELAGKIPRSNFKEKLMALLLGEDYGYSMDYADGCVAGLTLMKGVKLFNRWSVLPTLHMIFAYRTDGEKTHVLPLYLARKGKGVFGRLLAPFWLLMTKLAFKALQGEDGEVYENIRFSAENLLPIDAPVARYVGYINRLTPSVWSRDHEPTV